MNLLLLEESDFLSESLVRVDGRRHRQLCEVIRAEPGKLCKAGVLNGQIGTAEVISVEPDATELLVSLNVAPPAKLPVTLIAALPRPKTFRKVLHTATVMGVERLIFIESWKVDKSYWSTPLILAENVREEVILALEQAGDTILPGVEFRRRFKPFVEDELSAVVADGIAVAGHPAASERLPAQFIGRTTLVIGPEGGFTDYEIDLLAANGVQPMSLGRRIMRTEFAVTAILGRFGNE